MNKIHVCLNCKTGFSYDVNTSNMTVVEMAESNSKGSLIKEYENAYVTTIICPKCGLSAEVYDFAE